MGSKVKTVSSGGGSATGVANDFNSWLRQGLNNGSYGAQGQTQGIGNVLDTLLSGQRGSVSGQDSINDVLSRYSSLPSYNAPQISNPLNGVSAIGGMGNFDFSQGMGGRANAPGLNQLSIPSQVGGIGYSLPGGGVDLSSILSQVGSRVLGGGMDQSGVNGVAGGLANRNVDTSGAGNTSEFDAISKILGNQFNNDIANIRERYGVSSAGLTNENAYRAQALPQLSQALSQSALQQRGAAQTDVGLGLQANQAGLQGLLSSLGLGVEQRGQDINSQLGNRQADISTLGLASQQSLQNIANLLQGRQQDLQGVGLGVEQRGQDLNAILAGRGQDLQQRDQDLNAQLQGRGQDINQMGLVLQNLLGNRGMDIESILGQGNLNLNTGQANQNASLQSQQLLQSLLGGMGNLALGNAGLGMQGNQLAQQGQLAALAQLFGGYQQANQLGTPQAQTQMFQQQSGLGSFLSGITGLAGGIGSLMSGGALGGLGGLLGIGGGGGGIIPNIPANIFSNPSVPTLPSSFIPQFNLPRL